jgi:hypothetical protein
MALLFVGELYGIEIILAFFWYHLLYIIGKRLNLRQFPDYQSKFECSVDKNSKIKRIHSPAP